MSGFTLAFDTARSVLGLRISHELRDEEVEALRLAMIPAVADARRHGPLRFLCDNRAGRVFPEGTHEALWEVLARDADSSDRIALLVANSLAKVQSRGKSGGRAESFASENAAYTWLSVGTQAAA